VITVEKAKERATAKAAKCVKKDRAGTPKIGDIIFYRPKKHDGKLPAREIPPGLMGDRSG